MAWRIPPLAVPRAARPPTPIEALSQFDGVRLFVDRARQVRPNFHLTDDNGPAVAGICERLDGIPLAMELAAARCRSLSPAQILDGLGRRFPAAHRRRPRRPGPPADPGGVDRLEPRPAHRPPSRCCCAGCRCSGAVAPSTTPKRWWPATAWPRWRYSTAWTAWSPSPWSNSTTATPPASATGSWRPSANTAPATSTPPARPPRSRDRHARHYAAIARTIRAPTRKRRRQRRLRPAGGRPLTTSAAALDWLAETGCWDDYAGARLRCALFWILVAPAEGIAQLSRAAGRGHSRDPAHDGTVAVREGVYRAVCGHYAEAVADCERPSQLGEQLGDDGIVGRATCPLGPWSSRWPILLQGASCSPRRRALPPGQRHLRRSRGAAVPVLRRSQLRSGHPAGLGTAGRGSNPRRGLRRSLALGPGRFLRRLCSRQPKASSAGRCLRRTTVKPTSALSAGRARIDVDHFVRVVAIPDRPIARALVAMATGRGPRGPRRARRVDQRGTGRRLADAGAGPDHRSSH